MSPFYCEGSFTNEYRFEQMQVERYRMQSGYLYALTTDGEVVIFEFKVTGTNNDHSKCNMLARV